MFDIEQWITISFKIKDIRTDNWTCIAKPNEDHICQTFLGLPNK